MNRTSWEYVSITFKIHGIIIGVEVLIMTLIERIVEFDMQLIDKFLDKWESRIDELG